MNDTPMGAPFGAPEPVEDKQAWLRRAEVAWAHKRLGEATGICCDLLTAHPDWAPAEALLYTLRSP